ncbi:arylamine N-acetyltransferase [Paenibacillus sp.]|uniref:arylamine N-acetyltransferase n=1 Tax=Paenibacillus sp. TaxID=58172 RepID=UPI002D42AF2F|nr:arylamine N-acetyltransferase [Paenibacillus sp.]HZG84792.1 arylamine N-acetyltransferase [Paenibacillus sp.]
MTAAFRDAYLAALELEAAPPGLELLRALTHRHLHRFPFENISKIHYYLHRSREGLPWLPSGEAFLGHYNSYGFGGNCYILNAHFGRLLRELGFEVEYVRATGGNAHLANRVTVDGRSYYVDVGYGAPLFEPLDPEEQPQFSRRGEEIKIAKLTPGRYLIDRRANGQTIVAKQIEWRPVTLESFDADIAHSLRDEDDNPFMRRIVATSFKPGAAYSVINQKLFVKTDAGTEMHEYTSKAEWIEMLRWTFGFQSDLVLQALDFVEERSGRLFPK